MKIIGSDYDGTLNHNGISNAKLLSIEKWRNAGHKFGIVSGRGGDFRKILLQQIPNLKLDFFVACNGGYIMDESGAVIYESRCNEVSLSELAVDLFAWGCKFLHVKSDRYIFLVAKSEELPSFVSEDDVYLLKECPTINYFNQVSVQLPSFDDSSMAVEKIKEKYAKWLNPLQNGEWIDIVPAGVNKAQGMYRIMEFFGCVYDDVITIGDNINDIDMIGEFRSYAMKNGVDEVRNLANGIVSDVVELIEKELSF